MHGLKGRLNIELDESQSSVSCSTKILEASMRGRTSVHCERWGTCTEKKIHVKAGCGGVDMVVIGKTSDVGPPHQFPGFPHKIKRG